MEVYDFGLRLRELRERKHLSQMDLAHRLQLSRSQISAYECNTSYPSAEKLVELAVLLNTSADYLLGIENRPCIYLDEFSPNQQHAIMKIVELLKSDFQGKSNA